MNLPKLSKKDIIYALIILNMIIWAYSYVQTRNFYNGYVELLIHSANAEIGQGEAVVNGDAAASAPAVGSRDWILNECEKNGIDPVKVKCLIKHESGWDVNARHINADSVDLGLFQWNDKFQIKPGFISLGCIGNPECETYKFIEKVKADGNFSAWHGYTNNCLWLEE